MRTTLALAIAALWSFTATQTQADEPLTLSIPIYLINDKAGTGNVEYKIGIMLKLGDDEENNGYRMYEFDTGGTGFWAAHSINTNANIWSNSAVGTGPISITYASGNVLSGTAVTTRVTFEQGVTDTNSSYTAHVDTTVARISSGTNPGKPTDNAINKWTSTVDQGNAPIENYFYGDFGMGLGSGPDGLLAIVPQLLGTQNTGFIISIGTLPDAVAVAASSDPIVQTGTLQIGLTSAQLQRSAWAQTINMQGGTNSPQYPNSGQNTYQEVLSSGTLTISGTSGTNSYTTGIVYDTGAPSVVIHTGTSATLTDEINIQLTGTTGMILTGTTPDSLILDINPIGTTPGLNVVSGTTTDAIGYPQLYVNTGITAFFGRDVVYNLSDGYVGFNPIPEPGTSALLGATALALAGWYIRRRKR